MGLKLGARAWTALITVYIVWGSTYLAIAEVIDTIPPLLAASVRWILAGLIMMAIGSRSKLKGDRPRPIHWRNAAIIGIALCLGGNGLVSIAEERVPSGIAALLVATIPLFFAGLERVAFGARLTRVAIAGLVIGFVGAAVLVRPQEGAGEVDPLGAMLLFAAAFSWACGSLFAGRAELPKRPFTSTGMEMLCGGVAIGITAVLRGEPGRFDAEAVSLHSVVALGYLVVFGSLIAFTSYVWLLRNIPNSVTTTYAYVNPLVAVLLGWAIRDEPITTTTLLGGAIIVAAVASIVSFGQRRATPDRGEQIDLSAEDVPA